MVLATAESELAMSENGSNVQLAPLSVEVSRPPPDAPNNFVPALAKELMPVRANCSTTSQLAPSSVERQMKLSSATMIALSLTMDSPASVMMEGTTCHVLPLSVERATPLSLGSAKKNAQTTLPLIAKELMILFCSPLVPLQVAPLSVDLKIFK